MSKKTLESRLKMQIPLMDVGNRGALIKQMATVNALPGICLCDIANTGETHPELEVICMWQLRPVVSDVFLDRGSNDGGGPTNMISTCAAETFQQFPSLQHTPLRSMFIKTNAGKGLVKLDA
jgi:hypothetical protein